MSADFDIVVIPFVCRLSFYGSRICSDGGTVCSVFIPSCLLRLERWVEQYNDFRLVKIFCRKRHSTAAPYCLPEKQLRWKKMCDRFHHRQLHRIILIILVQAIKLFYLKLNYEINLSSEISPFFIRQEMGNSTCNLRNKMCFTIINNFVH